MNGLKVALVPVARVNFDIPLAEEVTSQMRRQLQSGGLQAIGPEELITNPQMAAQIAAGLKGQDFDVLLVLQATFADSSMLTTLAEAVERPIMLWGLPEARTGGRLRLNSLCGINLGAHALKLRGIHYDYVYAPPDDAGGMQRLKAIAAASRVQRRLRTARLGLVGEAPGGMDTCRLDAPALQAKFGLEVVQIPLEQVFERVRAVEAARIDPVQAGLDQKLGNLSSLDQPALRRSLSAYLVLKEIAAEEQLDGLAVRCWPEFFESLHCAACGAMSMLTDECLPCSCEADINGTVIQLILQWLSSEQAFGSDLVVIDTQADEIVLWHCGLAPLSMADPQYPAHATIHSNRKLPLLMEFPLKPGKVTIARLSQASGELQMALSEGEMLRSQPSFSGTTGVLRMRTPAGQVLKSLMDNGLEHHISLTYGEHLPALRKLCQLLDLPVLEL